MAIVVMGSPGAFSGTPTKRTRNIAALFRAIIYLPDQNALGCKNDDGVYEAAPESPSSKRALSEMARHSGSNVFCRGHLLVALRSYFDGSGKSNNRESKFLTLAGFAAENDLWDDFDNGWRSILRDQGATYLHMGEAIRFTGEYEGWDRDRVVSLVNGLVAFLAGMPSDHQFHGFQCSVDLAAYRAARKLKRIPSPERICARWGLSLILNWRDQWPAFPIETLDIFFDRNEEFLKHLARDWNDKQIRRQYPFYELIGTIAPVEMRRTPGVQAADLLAWSTHRRLSASRVAWQDAIAKRVLSATPWRHLHFNEAVLGAYTGVLPEDWSTNLPDSW